MATGGPLDGTPCGGSLNRPLRRIYSVSIIDVLGFTAEEPGEFLSKQDSMLVKHLSALYGEEFLPHLHRERSRGGEGYDPFLVKGVRHRLEYETVNTSHGLADIRATADIIAQAKILTLFRGQVSRDRLHSGYKESVSLPFVELAIVGYDYREAPL